MTKREIENERESIIKEYWFDQIPQRLDGTIAVIDAYCASANMAILLSKQPKRLIIVNDLNLQKAKELYQDSLLIGESATIPSAEFACNNHFKNIYAINVQEKTVLYMSINGSKVFEETFRKKKNGEIIAASFQNARSVVSYFNKKGPPYVLIKADSNNDHVQEDQICADLIRARLSKNAFDWQKAKSDIGQFVLKYYSQFPAAEINENVDLLTSGIDSLPVVPRLFLNDQGFIEFEK